MLFGIQVVSFGIQAMSFGIQAMSFGIQAMKYSYTYAVSPIEKHLCDFKNMCPEYKMR